MNENLLKQYRRRDEILGQLEEIDKRETAASRNYLECDEYRTLNTELTTLSGQIQVAEAVEADRQRRSGLSDEARKRNPGPAPLQPTAGPFRSFGEQLQAVIRSSTPGNAFDARLGELRATGMSEAVGSEGGFLVQTDMAAGIWKRAYQTGQILSRVRRIPISSGASSFKMPYIKETSRVSGSRMGGIQVYRKAEAATVTAKKIAFGEMKLELETGMALVYLTDELIADVSALESIVSQAVSEEIQVFTEDEIINGNGVGKPLGILNAGCMVSVAKESGQAAATLVPQNIVKMDARIWAPSVPGSVWFINQDVKPQLHLMSLAVGTGGMPVYMPANGLSTSPFGTLYGRPVVPIEHCPTLGTTGDIISADLNQYVMIEKGGVQAASSIHVQFLYGEQVLRFTWRNNGGVWGGWNEGALTPAKGANTQSPFVKLDAR